MLRIRIILLFIFLSSNCLAQQQLINRSYFYGRNYYVLRGGRAQMIIQNDKADLESAFTYLLYDAQNPSQSSSKKKAFNYILGHGFSSSALKVIIGKYAFTAIGNNTSTRWILEDGIPSVEAVWWASGVKVREVITPIYLKGVFKRSITLKSADLVTQDTVSIELSLPANPQIVKKGVMVLENKKSFMALSIDSNYSVKNASSDKSFEIGPIVLKKGEKKTIDTYLFLEPHPLNKKKLYAKAATIPNTIQSDLSRTQEKWEKSSNRIFTSDSLVQNMFDACRFVLPGYVAANGQMDAGIFEYGRQWVRDTSNTVLGLISIGEFEIARATLKYMLRNMINSEGTTMIAGGFDKPDREQFDQMGEFMHAMKSYVNWTGDASLLNENTDKIIAMIERPLHPVFRDSTGMVHNRREFWERTFDDAYELAYQTWMIEGLRDASDLSKYLSAEKKADRWRSIADEIQKAMLTNPTMKLVDHGHLIKRRNVTGEIADTVQHRGRIPGAPSGVETASRLMPDASMALPISLGIVDPKSDLAKNTLTELEKLWNRRWSFGGYDRYNTSSQGDQPGPWTFATTFIMRAQHAAGELDMSRRSLSWLYDISGGHTGAWLEEIPIIEHNSPGLIPWTSAEVAYFVVRDLLGIKFIDNQLIIKPALYVNTPPVKASLRYHKGRINLEIKGSGKVSYAIINGMKIRPNHTGSIEVPKDFTGGNITILNE